MESERIRELVVAAQRQDRAAVEAHVAEFRPTAVALARARLADRDAAEDVAQDALLLATDRIGEVRDPAAFPGWFAHVVRTCASRYLRGAARRDREDRCVDVVLSAELPEENDRSAGRLWSTVEELPEVFGGWSC